MHICEELWSGNFQRVCRRGVTIGCIAPASSSDESLDTIQQICQQHGYQIIFGESCYRKGLYGGTLEEQVDGISMDDDRGPL